ncbi:hypothetical protein [Nostoc sp.]|uniref:hypothetical protein n=1 Tax=Nostoc sp. TaxID=1180 RepID=UPI002FF82389
MTNRYIVDHLNNTGTVILNGKTYPDYFVDSVEADRGSNRSPYDFDSTNSYVITLTNDEGVTWLEIIYRKDCDSNLQGFLSAVKFPG